MRSNQLPTPSQEFFIIVETFREICAFDFSSNAILDNWYSQPELRQFYRGEGVTFKGQKFPCLTPAAQLENLRLFIRLELPPLLIDMCQNNAQLQSIIYTLSIEEQVEVINKILIICCNNKNFVNEYINQITSYNLLNQLVRDQINDDLIVLLKTRTQFVIQEEMKKIVRAPKQNKHALTNDEAYPLEPQEPKRQKNSIKDYYNFAHNDGEGMNNTMFSQNNLRGISSIPYIPNVLSTQMWNFFTPPPPTGQVPQTQTLPNQLVINQIATVPSFVDKIPDALKVSHPVYDRELSEDEYLQIFFINNKPFLKVNNIDKCLDYLMSSEAHVSSDTGMSIQPQEKKAILVSHYRDTRINLASLLGNIKKRLEQNKFTNINVSSSTLNNNAHVDNFRFIIPHALQLAFAEDKNKIPIKVKDYLNITKDLQDQPQLDEKLLVFVYNGRNNVNLQGMKTKSRNEEKIKVCRYREDHSLDHLLETMKKRFVQFQAKQQSKETQSSDILPNPSQDESSKPNKP